MKRLALLLLAVSGSYLSAADIDNKVLIDDFHIDRTEVTVGQFQAFAKATTYQTKAEKDGGGYEWGAGWEQRLGWTYLKPYGETAANDEPAAYINFYDAKSYCQWAGGRLPTAKEWSLAAYTEMRANPQKPFERGKTYPYSSGDKPDGLNASHGLDDFPRQAPVTATPYLRI